MSHKEVKRTSGKHIRLKKPERMEQGLPFWQTLIFSTIAPQFAVVFTNPIDTAKVRLQLQQKSQQVYNNSLDCIVKIYQNEGLAGLQKGLAPAIIREGFKNLFRIGMFEPLVAYLHDKQTEGNYIPLWKRMIAGAVTGTMGAIACNPFELIKTRMQSSAKASIAVGHQHHYTGPWHGLKEIIRLEGPLALYRGSTFSVIRSAMGSGCNLAVYSGLRDYLLENEIMANNFFTDAFSGLVSSFFCALIMNPIDVARTRLYNQPEQYKHGMDVMAQLLRKEGMGAFMKGFVPSFARLGPHFTLTFVFYEQMKRLAMARQTRLADEQRQEDLKDLFDEWDANQNGKLTTPELLEMAKFVFPPPKNSLFLTNLEHQQLLAADVKDLLTKFSAEDEIDYPTFVTISTRLESMVKEHQMAAAFSFFDQNHDGSIDRDELYAGLAALEFPHPSDRDGHLKEHKLKQLTDLMMTIGDPNHDGLIEYQDFHKILDEIKALQKRKQAKLEAVDLSL